MKAYDAHEFRGTLAKMVTEGWIGRVVNGIHAAIVKSYNTDAITRPVLTKSEIRHRFGICVEGFCIMRRDLQWAVPRIVDELPNYLRKKLDGEHWEPTDGARWGAIVTPLDVGFHGPGEIDSDDLSGIALPGTPARR